MTLSWLIIRKPTCWSLVTVAHEVVKIERKSTTLAQDAIAVYFPHTETGLLSSLIKRACVQLLYRQINQPIIEQSQFALARLIAPRPLRQ